MKERRTHGIVFYRLDVNEADRILHILTQEFGILQVIAKGVRRKQARLAGSVEPFCITHFHILGSSDLPTLRSASIAHAFDGFSTNYDALHMLATIGEVLRYSHIDTDDASDHFTLVSQLLTYLNIHPDHWRLVFTCFVILSLSYHGSILRFDRCCHSNHFLDEGGWYNPGTLGVSSNSDGNHSIALSVRDLKILNAICHQPLSTVLQTTVDEETVNRLWLVACGLIQDFLGRKLKSL